MPLPEAPAGRQSLALEDVAIDVVGALAAAGFTLLEAHRVDGVERYTVVRTQQPGAGSVPGAADEADAAGVDAEGVVVAQQDEAL